MKFKPNKTICVKKVDCIILLQSLTLVCVNILRSMNRDLMFKTPFVLLEGRIVLKTY